MTNNTLTLRSLDIPSIHRFGIGFDSMFDELLRVSARENTNYPPYNIVKCSEDVFCIEIAVAGFKEGDIDVNLENNQLSIVGNQIPEVNEVEYVFRGISSKSFTRTFTLAEHVLVTGASVRDGILTVNLERQVPDEKKPKKIQIAYTK